MPHRGRKARLCKGPSLPLDRVMTLYVPQLSQNENCYTPSPPVDNPCHVVYNSTYVLYKEAPARPDPKAWPKSNSLSAAGTPSLLYCAQHVR